MARLIFVVALLMAASCASATTLDRAQLEADVPAAVSPTTPGDVTAVSCPEEIPRGIDLEVICRAKLGDDSITVLVQQLDNDGALSLTVVEELIELDGIETGVAVRFAADLALDTDLRCEGSRLRVLGSGLTLQCSSATDFTDPELPAERPFTVTVAADGTYEVRLS